MILIIGIKYRLFNYSSKMKGDVQRVLHHFWCAIQNDHTLSSFTLDFASIFYYMYGYLFVNASHRANVPKTLKPPSFRGFCRVYVQTFARPKTPENDPKSPYCDTKIVTVKIRCHSFRRYPHYTCIKNKPLCSRTSVLHAPLTKSPMS